MGTPVLARRHRLWPTVSAVGPCYAGWKVGYASAGLSAGFVAGSAEECGGATRFRVALHNCLDFLPQKSNSHLVCSGLGGTHERSPLHEPGGIIMTRNGSANMGIATLGVVPWLP